MSAADRLLATLKQMAAMHPTEEEGGSAWLSARRKVIEDALAKQEGNREVTGTDILSELELQEVHELTLTCAPGEPWKARGTIELSWWQHPDKGWGEDRGYGRQSYRRVC